MCSHDPLDLNAAAGEVRHASSQASALEISEDLERIILELVSTTRNRIPGGAIPGRMVAFDGRGIRYCLWPQSGWRGTVCLFGGRNDFIEKYFETIGELQQRGFAVAIMDWRGQGGSDRLLPDPRKGHVDDFAQYESDLGKF